MDIKDKMDIKADGQTAGTFNEKARLVIYAENAAGAALAATILKQAGQDADIRIRRAEAPLPPGSWGC